VRTMAALNTNVETVMHQQSCCLRDLGKASTGVASSTCASNQNLQTSGVTNVVSSQAMTAIPLPMER